MGVAVSNPFRIQVNAASGSPPAWTGTPSPVFTEGAPAEQYVLPVTGGTSFSLIQGAFPNGVSLNQAGRIDTTGAETQGTSIGLRLRATNANGSADSAVFNLLVQSPPAVNDTWTLLNTNGNPSWLDSAPWFNRPCCVPDGRIFVYWRKTALNSGIWVFNPATPLAGFTPVLLADTTMPAEMPGGPGQWENTGMDYDDTNGVIFSTMPAPGAPLGTNGDWRYDPIARVMTYRAYTVGGFEADSPVGVWNGKAYQMSLHGAPRQVAYRATPSGAIASYSDSALATLGASANGEDLSWAAMGVHRGGVDHRVGMAWQFNNSNELYVRDLIGGPGDGKGWVHLQTTGSRPINGFVATLVEHLNAIVAFTGNTTGNNGGAPSADPLTTYVLDLATLHWRYGPTSPTQVTPDGGSGNGQAGMALVYDRWNRKTYWLGPRAGHLGYAVWLLELEETQL